MSQVYECPMKIKTLPPVKLSEIRPGQMFRCNEQVCVATRDHLANSADVPCAVIIGGHGGMFWPHNMFLHQLRELEVQPIEIELD